jgi:hypothetical protein
MRYPVQWMRKGGLYTNYRENKLGPRHFHGRLHHQRELEINDHEGRINVINPVPAKVTFRRRRCQPANQGTVYD